MAVRPGSVISVVAALWALVLATALRPPILGDDAAIGLRYAERLAEGRGFTYNDHERVLGASNPLFTLTVAALTRGLGDAETAARTATVLLLAITAALAAHLAKRLSGSAAAGVLAGLALPAEPFFRQQVLLGLETGASSALGLGATAALLAGRQGLTGCLLGLALWNKLDALALVLPCVAAAAWSTRAAPARLAVAVVGTLTPWAVFATVYFGSPIPHSLTTKLAHGTATPFDPLWILRGTLSGTSAAWWGAAALAFLAAGDRLAPQARLGAAILLGWTALHAAAYSVVDLGDVYPWYRAMLVPPAIVLASAALPAALRASTEPDGPRRAAAFGAVFCFIMAQPLVGLPGELRRRDRLVAWQAFEADRRLAGIFLDRRAGADEIVASGFGWVAFEARRPFHDQSGLNRIASPGPPSYVVLHGAPYDRGGHAPVAPAGYEPIATFDLAARLFPGYSWFVVYGRPGARATRAARPLEDPDIARLRDPRLVRAWRSAPAAEENRARARAGARAREGPSDVRRTDPRA